MEACIEVYPLLGATEFTTWPVFWLWDLGVWSSSGMFDLLQSLKSCWCFLLKSEEWSPL